jgi:hypothetical protein
MENTNTKKDALYAYLIAEANLMTQISESAEVVNNILRGIAGSESKNYNSYMSDEDYKTMFNMDDELIKQWEYYAKNVLGKPEMVDERPKSSFISSKKNKKQTPNVVRGGRAEKNEV